MDKLSPSQIDILKLTYYEAKAPVPVQSIDPCSV